MDQSMLSVITRIINDYGDDVFGSMLRTNAILLDLAPGLTRERILVRDFIEINGYHIMKDSGSEYPIIRAKLVCILTDQFCLERSAAMWTVHLFAAALGYETPEILALPMTGTPSPIYKGVNAVQSLVAIGKAHTVAVASDYTVWAHGRNEHFQCDVAEWRNILSVAAGDAHTVGLRADGTVLAAGLNTYDQCDVAHLEDIASIYAFGHDTLCVRCDGSVVHTGRSKLDVSHFKNIQTIAKFPEGVFGIREDGTVAVATVTDTSEPDGEEIQWALSLTGAKQIISTYVMGSVVLKQDGRIHKMNKPDNYFAIWRDVVSIVDITDYFAILRADGTVRILPYDRDLPRVPTEADRWRDIVAIYGKYKRLIGLTRQGGLTAVCTDSDWLRRNGSLDYVSNWFPVGPREL